eukprot:2803711-Rhodomonas_salina.4
MGARDRTWGSCASTGHGSLWAACGQGEYLATEATARSLRMKRNTAHRKVQAPNARAIRLPRRLGTVASGKVAKRDTAVNTAKASERKPYALAYGR